MLELNVNVDGALDEVVFALEKLGMGIFPETGKAIKIGAGIIQTLWKQETAGAFKYPSGSYLRAIHNGLIYPVGMNPYHGRVVNSMPYAEDLEYGYPAFDMKKALYTSHKIRISKKGKRYLIIPFRHGTPSRQGESGTGGNRATMRSMPAHVYDPAKRLIISQMKSRWAERSQQDPEGNKVAIRRNYEWGERLTKQALESVGASQAEIQRYSGMLRFPREGARTTGSQYMTFRVMTEDSKGWIHPAQPPLKIAERTINKAAPILNTIITDAFAKDMGQLVRRAGLQGYDI